MAEEASIDIDSMSNEEVDELIGNFVPEEEEADNTEEKTIEPVVEESVIEEKEEEENTTNEEETTSDIPVDMDSIYQELFVDGIKAAGSNRVIRDAEHLKTLVRIGIGANKSNKEVKPYLRQLKSLEQANIDLNDGDTLNFVVDLLKGDKGAISKLIKDKGIDEDTVNSWFDEENKSEYTANNHMIPEGRLELESVISDTKNTGFYDKTISFLGDLDSRSEQFLAENPEVLRLIHNDMQKGIFDKALDETMYRIEAGTEPEQSKLLAYVKTMQDNTFVNSLVGAGTTKTKTDKVKSRKKKATPNGRKNVATNNTVDTKEIKPSTMSNKEFDDFFSSLGLDN